MPRRLKVYNFTITNLIYYVSIVLLLEISKPVYEFLVYQGVDSFLFDPSSKTHFLMYWDGSLFNHCKDSAATFMNLRPGGLTCKYVVEYKQYTKEVDMFNAEENLFKYGVKTYETTCRIDSLSHFELYHHDDFRLEPECVTIITDQSKLPKIWVILI